MVSETDKLISLPTREQKHLKKQSLWQWYAQVNNNPTIAQEKKSSYHAFRTRTVAKIMNLSTHTDHTLTTVLLTWMYTPVWAG